MTDTDRLSAELTVPDTAMHTVWSLLRNTEGLDTHNAVSAAQMIAAPIVAAELRAQADRIATHSAGLAQMYAHRLRVRADEVEAASCCAPETRQPPITAGADVRPEGPCDLSDMEASR